MRSFTVPVDDYARKNDTTLTPASMRAIVVDVLSPHVHVVPAEELLRVLDRRTEHGRAFQTPQYHLRYREFRFAEQGLVGRSDIPLFRHSVLYRMQEALADLRKEQPDADWKLVAFGLGTLNLRMTVPQQAPKDQRVAASTVDAGGLLDGKKIGADTEKMGAVRVAVQEYAAYTEIPDFRLLAQLVFADIAQSEHTHPVGRSANGNKEGPGWQWYTSFDMRHMPQGMRAGRRKCEALLARWEAAQAAGATAPNDEPDAPAAPRKRVFTEVERDMVIELRVGGASPASIAKLLNVVVDDILAVLDDERPTQPPELPTPKGKKA